jgi:hypothetical protein
MLETLIEMIEGNAEEMAVELKSKLLRDPVTSSFQVLDDRTLYANIFEIYSRLGHWLLGDTEKGEVRTHYSNVGKQRFEEGFPLHEVVQSIVATKRHIWDTISEKGIMRTARDLNSAVDFITFLNRFFDMATYYTTRGYYNALDTGSKN